MEEYKKDDRGRSKAKRLTETDPHTKVDSSTWTPSAPENAGVKTGARPLVKRLFKKGGKVIGADAMKRADRKPRKAGGRAEQKAPWIDDLINRDVRMANDKREGVKHEGAFKKGGKARASGGKLGKYIDKAMENYGNAPNDSKNKQRMTDGVQMAASKISGTSGAKIPATRKSGGRTHKLGGGMLGNNPVTDQYAANAKAAGPMKKGGRIKKARGGPEGDFAPSKNKPSLDEIGEMIRNMPQDAVYQAPKKAAPVNPSKNLDDYFKPSTGDDERAANAAAFDAQQQAYQRSLPQNRKHGGTAHPDVAEDKALIRKMVKPSARTGKAEGGSKFDSPTHSFTMKLSNGEDTTTHNLSMPGESAANALVNAVKFANKGGWNVDNIEHTGSSAGAGSSAGLMKRGGRAMKYGGGGIFSGDSKEKIPGATGGRDAHAKGGRTKAGKTTINIVMGGQRHQDMPDAPVMPPKPPMGVPVPPPQMAGGAPMGGGMPPQMPPQGMPRKAGGRTGKMVGGSLGNASGYGQPMMNQQQPMMGQPMMPQQPMMNQQQPMQGYPMPRKSGGRAYPIDTGSGGANARLEKIDAYGLKPSKRK